MKHYVIFLIFLCLSTSLYATDSRYEGRTIAAAENLKYVMVLNAPLACSKTRVVLQASNSRAGFVFGARYGNGVTSCKLAGGGWVRHHEQNIWSEHRVPSRGCRG